MIDVITTADKVRALASADYDRTEISKILGIRYQHVRHVILRSGMTGGLRHEVEAERADRSRRRTGTARRYIVDGPY